MDYYEFLQISPNAESETIHRVYRFLASRFHPDNPETSDPEKFAMLRHAYDILSDPGRRAEYDHKYFTEPSEAPPISSTIDFMDDIEGELNRRLAVLAVLYYRRRNNPFSPEVGLAEIEARMGFPRDYLDFTTWYLMRKGYITRADNSDFTLTAEGVDFVEAQRAQIPTLNKLLTDGAAVRTSVPPRDPFADFDDAHVPVATVRYAESAYEAAPAPAAPEQMPTATAEDAALVHVTAPSTQIDNGFDLNAIRAEAVRNPLSYDLANLNERRSGTTDRRTGQPDTRLTFSRERRRRQADRRGASVN
ncbi:MAG: J domain-containing protein [Terracidiphilus sp.]|nr:J domain-containing protein [Terracidiphilus sp.]